MHGLPITTFHDADMIPGSIGIPVNHNDVPGRWLIIPRLPLMMRFSPVHKARYIRKLGNGSGFDISALVGAPRHEASAPAFPAPESVPAPELSATMISDLLLRHLDDSSIPYSNVVTAVRIVPKYMCRILLVTIAAPAMLLCLHIGKDRCILDGISSVPFDGPGDISVSIVIAL